MIDKCANPACSEPFHYFRSGRIYRIDRREIHSPSSQVGAQRSEHFWLCGSCSPRFRVVLQADDSVAVAEMCLGPVYAQRVQSPPLTISSAGMLPISNERLLCAAAAVQRTPSCDGHKPRILVLDVELKTLGFIEQMLQDSGLGAISCTSVVEAISLVATGFFDILIAIDRPDRSRSAAMVSALAAARIHCKSCLCWRVDTVRQRCIDFVEEMAQGKESVRYGDDGVRLLPSLEPRPAAQPARGTSF
jgi:hypothetical protein